MRCSRKKMGLRHVIVAVMVIAICGLYGVYVENVRPHYWEVKGSSMEPVLHTGDLILCKKLAGNTEPGRYEIVLVEGIAERLSVKCILGLPGDVVKFTKDSVYLNGLIINYPNPGGFELECVLEEDEYFVVGVNARDSIDSRYVGAINRKRIKAVFIETGEGEHIEVAKAMNW